MTRKRSDDLADSILRFSEELQKQYRVRQTVNGPVPVPGSRLQKKPLRGMNRKNLLRRLRSPPRAKSPKPRKVPLLVEHTERDSSGREVTRFFGDPVSCWAQFTNEPIERVKLRGHARDGVIDQMHAAGLKDQQIADLLHVNVKTVERAMDGRRKRLRTRKKR